MGMDLVVDRKSECECDEEEPVNDLACMLA